MAGSTPRAGGLRRWLLAAAALGACTAGSAQPSRSALDEALFYQVLIGEMQLSTGQPGAAFEILLDAARRTNDDALFQRSIEIALQARAGEQALGAARAWRQARPKAVEAMRFEAQILLALNRLPEMAAPLGSWLAEASMLERPALIAAIPRLLQRSADRKQAQALVEKVLEPYRHEPGTRVAALLAIGRTSLAAGATAVALALAREAQATDPQAVGPVLLALELLPGNAEAEAVVTRYLDGNQAEPAVRQAYVRTLTQAQRYTEATQQLERLTAERPDVAEPWLTLGALQLELKRPREAEASLQKYLNLLSAEPAQTSGPAARIEADAEGDEGGSALERGQTQAWLLLAQAAEQRGDLKAAEAWLARIDNPRRALEVQSRKASLLARQGQLKEARALIRAVPERQPEDARAKLLAEAQLLREAKRWRDAAELLAEANRRQTDDVDLLYEQAMAEEKIERFAEMERLLRRVIELKPAHPHAHNALGYSLADRNQRLPEARELIRKALELSPGDPFITDSLGWVEFRLGNREEAARLLRQAYRARPDTEIAAHLGEVLWALGEQEEARRIWRDARGRDADNEVLRETLARLRVGL
jgi:tetratricopeptide (TPR) repeat protein